MKKNRMQIKVNLVWLLLSLSSCATPRIWIISQQQDSGVIGYQNYDPKTDKGGKISRLVHCIDHNLIANPIKHGYSQPSTYQAYNNGYGMTTIYPLDGGAYQWREYHYTCNKKDRIILPSDTDYCEATCIQDVAKGMYRPNVTAEMCINKFCGGK